MKTFRRLARNVLLVGGGVLSAALVQAQTCQPGIATAFQAHPAAYTTLLTAIAPEITNLFNGLSVVNDQTSYESLLSDARALAESLTDGRVLISLPDGTVVIDTARPDDPSNNMPVGNSFQHFRDKTVNENHNSRIAILAAQEYPCGIGLERKLSSSTGQVETTRPCGSAPTWTVKARREFPSGNNLPGYGGMVGDWVVEKPKP